MLFVLAALGANACDRNVEPFVPGEKPVTPDLSRIFPEPQGADGTDPVQPDVRPAASPFALLPAPASQDEPAIQGIVELAPEFAQRVPDGATLFLIAYRSEATGGPPLAVRRFTAPRFPLRFEVGPEHLMIPGSAFEGELRLSARLDSDGNAMTRLPGDLHGSAAQTVSPGARDVAIVLDQRL